MQTSATMITVILVTLATTVHAQTATNVGYVGGPYSARDYCNVKCYGPYAKYPNTACGGCPISASLIQPDARLSDADKRKILDYHNEKRSALAMGRVTDLTTRTSSNMKEMEWDDELSYMAQCWASSGNGLTHDKCRNVPGYIVGQNGGRFGYAQLDLTLKYQDNLLQLILDSWFDEKSSMTVEDIRNLTQTAFDAKEIGHFTQLAWANSNKIGCGKAFYQEPSNNHYYYLLFCDYAPSGNWPGESVYKFGPVCSACDDGEFCFGKYPGLCSSQIALGAGLR